MRSTVAALLVIHLLVIFPFAVQVVAGPFEDANDAWRRGDYPTAHRLYKPLAEQGDTLAQIRIGVMYSSGVGVPKDNREAAKWYRKAVEQYRKGADKGDAASQHGLGNMYWFGRGVPLDNVEAVKWWRRAAGQGYVISQETLAFMYSRGEGVPLDKTEAKKWYRKAAEQGEVSDQYSLGEIYHSEKKYPEAAMWWRRAAEQGDDDAQYHLGLLYYNGQGVPQDFVLAHMWLNLSASQSNESATKNRDLTASKMTPAQIAEAQKLAREWKPKKER